MKELFERRLLETFNAFRRGLKLYLDRGDTLIINIEIGNVSLYCEERVDKSIDFYEFLRELADALDNGDVKLRGD